MLRAGAAVFGLLLPVTLQGSGAPTRAIDFETDEGTWMSLDVAPDGKALVFELLGDIYSLDSAGGMATPLLTGSAYESQPVFSPDGSRFAFISDRSGHSNVWVADRDGRNPRQVSRHTGTGNQGKDVSMTPAWSANGKRVFAARTNTSLADVSIRIWSYALEDGAGVPIDNQHRMDPVASSDGRYLYYSSRDADLWAYEQMWEIRRRDLRTEEEEVVLAPHGGAFRPVLSPDGKSLAYATRIDGQTGLRLRNFETGMDRLLAYPIQLDTHSLGETPVHGLLPRYAFTPDGGAIVISYAGKLRRIDIATAQVRDIPFNARVHLDIGPALRHPQPDPEGPVRARIIQAPRTSPDGATLAFSALGHLYTMASGRPPRRLTKDESTEFQPAWSPDGKWIAYVTWNGKEGGHIWKARLDGRGAPERLTTQSAYYRSPVFSPDGRQVIAVSSSAYDRIESQTPETEEIVAVSAIGGTATRIAAASGPDDLHFTDDAKRLYFYAAGTLQSVQLDGTGRRELARVWSDGHTNGSTTAEALRVSPDAKWLLAQIAGQLYVMPLPPAGEKAAEIDIRSPPPALRKLTDQGSDFMGWGDHGRSIQWSVGSTFHRRAFVDGEPGETKRTVVSVELPRDVPRGATVLRGATVVTMKGKEIIRDADLVIVDNRITAVGRRGDVAVPKGATVRDLTGRYITPGFVNTHAHWREVRKGVLDLDDWNFKTSLAYGITSGLDPFSSIDTFVYQDLIDAGKVVGPRVHTTGTAIFSSYRFEAKEELKSVLQQYRDHYRTNHLKYYWYWSGDREQRRWFIDSARELGMWPTAEGAETGLILSFSMDGFPAAEHRVPAAVYKDVVQLYARSGTGYTPANMAEPRNRAVFVAALKPDAKLRRFMPASMIETLTVRQPRFDERTRVYPLIAEGAAKIFRAGGHVGVGDHGEFQGLGYHWEMEMLAAGGLTPHEVLEVATRSSSEVIGRDSELGTLEPGKYADLVVLRDDPLADIRNAQSIQYVMKNGRLYDGDTLEEIRSAGSARP